MSPFGYQLNLLRLEHGLRQTDLAELLGYEQTYLSALELGTKGPPSTEFVTRLIHALALDKESASLLMRARENSNRHIVIPADAPKAVFEACNELRRQLDYLHPAQVDMILRVLRMPLELQVKPKDEARRIKRRKLTQRKSGEGITM